MNLDKYQLLRNLAEHPGTPKNEADTARAILALHKPETKPDKYQQAVIDDAATGIGNVIVRARAGSGKTSTIINAVERVPRGLSVLICAFNAKLKPELQRKIEARGLCADVSTLHSYGMRQCGKVRIDERKARRHAEEQIVGASKEHTRAVLKAVSLAKGMLLRTRPDILALIPRFQLEVKPSDERRFAEDVLAVMKACFYDADSVDFDDQIWLPVVCKRQVWQYDRVFVDEAQDLNLAQIRLVSMACRPGGRICAVGDDRQAIYAFRGADEGALGRIRNDLSAKVFPLSVSYRCARSIVRLAQGIVQDIECAPNAPDGTVEKASDKRLVLDAENGDFVVSRKNAPLVKVCLRLLKNGKAAAVLGRDVSSELSSLVQRAKTEDVGKMLQWVESWKAREIKRILDQSPEADIDRVEDTAACILAISEGEESVEDIRAKLRTMFDESGDDNRVTLMSTHKAKGLEANRVWILRDTYNPSKSTEEANLLYIAITRAKKELYLVEGIP